MMGAGLIFLFQAEEVIRNNCLSRARGDVYKSQDMAQRMEAAKLLLDGSTYEQIVKTVEISTATISRINRCIQYGTGGYRQTIEKVREKQQ